MESNRYIQEGRISRMQARLSAGVVAAQVDHLLSPRVFEKSVLLVRTPSKYSRIWHKKRAISLRPQRCGPCARSRTSNFLASSSKQITLSTNYPSVKRARVGRNTQINLTLKNKVLYIIYIRNLTYSRSCLRDLSDLAERLTACVYSLLIGVHGAQLQGRVYQCKDRRDMTILQNRLTKARKFGVTRAFCSNRTDFSNMHTIFFFRENFGQEKLATLKKGLIHRTSLHLYTWSKFN